MVAVPTPPLVSACLPARDEEATVGTIVARIGRLDAVDEILVVDDGSVDGTAAAAARAGARVVPSWGTGKGAAMRTAVAAARGDVLVFCDADLVDFDPSWVTALLAPLLGGPGDVGFVKATYERAGEGGRVTELVARPLISLLFPELAGFDQPLAGEIAARRSVLESVTLADGYGVDLALLLDVVAAIGVDRCAQVDLGRKRHRNRPLAELGVQAREVLAVALERAGMLAPSAQR